MLTPVKYSQQVLKPIYEERREQTKNVPGFWRTVLGSSELLAEYINYEDSDLLDHLIDLYIEWDEDDVKNFTIQFEFEENEFLDTLKLSKRFEIEKTDEEEAHERYVSTPVELKWKKNKDLTKFKEGRDTSFFNWFNFVGKGPGDFKGGETVALIVSDEIYPHALKLYVDAATQEELEYDISESGSEEGEEDEQEGEEEEDDDDEEEHQDEEDHEDAPPKKKVKGA
jgi:template-activating factor I